MKKIMFLLLAGSLLFSTTVINAQIKDTVKKLCPCPDLPKKDNKRPGTTIKYLPQPPVVVNNYFNNNVAPAPVVYTGCQSYNRLDRYCDNSDCMNCNRFYHNDSRNNGLPGWLGGIIVGLLIFAGTMYMLHFLGYRNSYQNSVNKESVTTHTGDVKHFHSGTVKHQYPPIVTVPPASSDKKEEVK